MTIWNDSSWFVPDWPAPEPVRSLQTTRRGGLGCGPFSSFNLGLHVGDDPKSVAANRAKLDRTVGCKPVWMNQVHGTRVLDAGAWQSGDGVPEADAALTSRSGTACVVMTADCLPVLFCDESGQTVAAAHAGWRGLAAGVLEATVTAMRRPGTQILVWIGPAIGSRAFEVGDDVRHMFLSGDTRSAEAFTPCAPGKGLADLVLLARQRLQRLGIERIYGGDSCTFHEPDRFFSYRRDGQTGRMASLIWLEQ